MSDDLLSTLDNSVYPFHQGPRYPPSFKETFFTENGWKVKLSAGWGTDSSNVVEDLTKKMVGHSDAMCSRENGLDGDVYSVPTTKVVAVVRQSSVGKSQQDEALRSIFAVDHELRQRKSWQYPATFFDDEGCIVPARTFLEQMKGGLMKKNSLSQYSEDFVGGHSLSNGITESLKAITESLLAATEGFVLTQNNTGQLIGCSLSVFDSAIAKACTEQGVSEDDTIQFTKLAKEIAHIWLTEEKRLMQPPPPPPPPPPQAD